VLSIKSECLSKLVCSVKDMFAMAVAENVEHNHSERNHQGPEGRLLTVALPNAANGNAPIARRKRLGGLLNFYHRKGEPLAASHRSGGSGCWRSVMRGAARKVGGPTPDVGPPSQVSPGEVVRKPNGAG